MGPERTELHELLINSMPSVEFKGMEAEELNAANWREVVASGHWG
jgi:hypothetical protein